jgi:hypothetical protein
MGQNMVTGKARVRLVLIEPLEQGGMKRARGVTAQGHDAFLDKVASELRHMSEDALKGLREYLITVAGEKCVWPRLNFVLAKAWALEPKPPRNSDYAKSIVRSAMGRAAKAGGYLPELFSEARRLGPPSTKLQVAKLEQLAEDNRHLERVIEQRRARGIERPEDNAWLAHYRKWHDAANKIVDELLQEQGETS